MLGIALRLRGITWLGSISLRLLSVDWLLRVAGLGRIALILRCIALRLSVVGLGFGPGNRAAF